MLWLMHIPPNLVASAEVCAELNMDRSTLSRWVSAGKIAPAMKMPGRNGAMLFNRSDIERLKTGAAA